MNKNFTISEILDAIKMFNQIKKKVNTNDNYKKKVIKDDNTDILILTNFLEKNNYRKA